MNSRMPDGSTGLGTSAARIIQELRARRSPRTDVGTPTGKQCPRDEPGHQPTSASRSGTGDSSLGVRIPRLHCPEPFRINESLGREVNDRLVSWAERIGIYPGQLDELRAKNYGRFAMLIHPDTDDLDRLLLAAQGLTAEFAVDDQYCDDERTGSDPSELGCRLALAQSAMDPVYILDKKYDAQLQEAMKADPVRVGLTAYMDRVAEYGTPAQVDRARLGTVTMFIPMNWEAGWRVKGGLPPVWEYLATRQANSFGPCLTIIDVVGGYEVPGPVYSLPAVRRATMLAGNASIILNDIYSMAKEREPGIGDGGLPDIIAADEEGCSLQEAVDRTAVIHDDYVRALEVAQRELMATVPSPELWRYLQGLFGWLGGSHEFHRGIGRYNSADAR